MKVRVDHERCQGHTLCAMNAPDVFLLDEIDGHASVADENVAADREDAVADAADSCPEQAVVLSERAGA